MARNHGDGIAMAEEGDRVTGVAALLPDLIQRHETKGSPTLGLPDRSTGSEGLGGRGVDRDVAAATLSCARQREGRSGRVLGRGTGGTGR